MSVFFRLLPDEDKGAVLAKAVAAARERRSIATVIHGVHPASFRQIPGSPFAYRVSERIRRLFTGLPPFEAEGRTVKQGLAAGAARARSINVLTEPAGDPGGTRGEEATGGGRSPWACGGGWRAWPGSAGPSNAGPGRFLFVEVNPSSE